MGPVLAFLIALASLFAPRLAAASNAKAIVVLEIERLETRIEETRWNLNTHDEKRALLRELALLKKLYDRIVAHESDLMAFPCAGATIDPEGGPPISDEASDRYGLMALSGGESRTGAPGPSGRAPGLEGGAPLGNGIAPPRFGFVFVRQITDVEVGLLAEIVRLEDEIEREDWHLNNQDERRAREAEMRRAQAALRRIRNSRC